MVRAVEAGKRSSRKLSISGRAKPKGMIIAASGRQAGFRKDLSRSRGEPVPKSRNLRSQDGDFTPIHNNAKWSR